MYFVNYFYVTVTDAAPKCPNRLRRVGPAPNCPNAELALPDLRRRLVPFRKEPTKVAFGS